jgi:surface carbohydrate biosynthesis protein (TIGR04326 family)
MSTQTSKSDVLIWDSEFPAPSNYQVVILWRQFADKGQEVSRVSLPEYIELHADRLHDRFLGFVHDLGNTQIKGKSVQDHLTVTPSMSYWWMTLFASTRWNDSSRTTDAIKLLALEEILNSRSWVELELASEDLSIQHSIQRLCIANGKSFSSDPVSKQKSKRSGVIRKFSLVVSAHLVLIRQILWLVSVRPLRPTTESSQIMIFDYLMRFDVDQSRDGNFVSQYWNLLIEKFSKKRLRATWVHQFIESSATPSAKSAQQLLSRINKKKETTHYLFESRLSLRIVIQTLKTYWRLVLSVPNSAAMSRAFVPSDSKLDLWPLFAHEWDQSLLGTTAMRHCILISTIQSSLATIPHCPLGMYLMENQPWEMALIDAWKANGHGQLIGVVNAPIRFWDLRHFVDRRSISRDGANRIRFRPTPDRIAVNSLISRTLLEKSGVSPEKIVDVEALMYQYLDRSVESDEQRADDLLILGDFFTLPTHRLLNIVQESLLKEQHIGKVWFKPHPFDSGPWPINESLGIVITNDLLPDIFKKCSIVIAASSSTSSLEAYCANKNVISILDPAIMNYSPLRNLSDAVFVSNSSELSLELSKSHQRNTNRIDSLLHLNSDLKLWTVLLGL